MRPSSSILPYFQQSALRHVPVVLLLLTLLSLPAAEPSHQMPRNPSSAKECAICHFRWVDTFFVDGRGTDLVPLQTEPVVGTTDMCFSCHDGSIRDSRWAFDKERGHRIGVPPKPGMVLPDSFPLDPQGKLQCVTCHSAHGVPSTPSESTSTFLRVVNTNSSICLICHPTMAGDSAGANHPLGQVTNTIPQVLWNQHTPAETAAHVITCETCHNVHGNQQEHLLKQNVSDSTLCLTCHRELNPINPDGTRNFFHVINVTPTNAIVPANLLTNGALLSKNGTLTCLTCHKIHQNKIEKHLLVAKVDNQSSFCFNCHSDKRSMAQNKHNLTTAFPDAKNLAGKSVTESGPCSACHLPHQNARAPVGSDFSAGLCMSCHGVAGLAAKTNLFGSSHPISVPWPPAAQAKAGTKPISLPLYDAQRHQSATGNVTCLTCHDPHLAQPLGALAPGARFLRKTVPLLCQECHTNQVNVLSTKHDLLTVVPSARSGPADSPSFFIDPVAEPIRNILGQTPTESGSCGVCHLVHSPNNSTWARTLPANANPADKCRSCHQPGGPAEKKLVQQHSHPMDVSLQEAGLKTTLPLYGDSSKTNAPGKVTCNTCHDPHRMNPDSLAKRDAEVKGSAQRSFLRMPVSPAPKLCADCHVKEALVVRTEHDLSLFLPDSKNSLGQPASETGPCGACHLAHNAPAQAKLWGRGLNKPWLSTPLVDGMCRSCHSSEAIAEKKVPAFSYHPPVTVVNLPTKQGYDRSFFPIFDPVTGQQVSAGGISCSSCHNVHQWSSPKPEPGPGVHLEGDSNNSFLRHRSAELPCKVCHGPDSIYRYQYYHKSSAHQRPSDSQLDDFFP